MFDIKREKWEESYSRGENFIYYPKEEVVKFINRFIKKRKSTTEFLDILKSSEKLRALDFGCGIGRITILLREFNIESYGIDISQNAINEALKFSEHFGYDIKEQLKTYDGSTIPFDDCFFDFTISDCVMDSMSFELAKQLIKEIERVTKKYFFVSLISSDSIRTYKQLKNNFFMDEIEIEENHENGTIQSFFDMDKIDELIQDTSFKIKWCEKHLTQNIKYETQSGRYYLVLEKEMC